MTRKSSKANGGKAPKETCSKEPEVERGFRSLEELNAVFSERRTIGLRSLGELSKEFQRQQPAQEAKEAKEATDTGSSGVLKKIFEGRGFGFITPDRDHGAGDVFLHFSDVTGTGARSLAIGTWVRYDVEPDVASGRLRAKNVSILNSTPSKTPAESPSIQEVPEQTAEVAPTSSSSSQSYNRDIMLGVFKSLAASSQLGTRSRLKLSTVHVPRPSRVDQEDPCLDDERLIARLEARLDKETGADDSNMQTFGTCSGWSFEEAVAANEKLRITARSEDSTAAGSFDEPADVSVSERGEESDASDDRKEARQETAAADEWSWESSFDKTKLWEEHRQSWEVEQKQTALRAASVQVFQ
jgi:cold shock CspA family protein